ncbi:MAG TPA: adenylate/guanylate cyclase domain-containing protein [Solirubrobacterales bacterium]
MSDPSSEFNLASFKEAVRLSEAAKSSSFSISAALAEQQEEASTDITSAVEIEDVEKFPSLSDLYLEKRKWLRIRNVVAVSTDLKDSTALNFDKYAQTSARLYQAVTGSVVRLFSLFDPQFIAIQGDGAFALFHGELAFERAFCAAASIKKFSLASIGPLIDEKFSDSFPDSGLKTGIASGILVAKKVGVRGTNEPIWAGKPVNFASKCAQGADRHELIVTSAVYEKLAPNDYIDYSCGCPNGVPYPLWGEIEVEKLGKHSNCMRLGSNWCETHGDEFCRAILDGKKTREDVVRTAAAA